MGFLSYCAENSKPHLYKRISTPIYNNSVSIGVIQGYSIGHIGVRPSGLASNVGQTMTLLPSLRQQTAKRFNKKFLVRFNMFILQTMPNISTIWLFHTGTNRIQTFRALRGPRPLCCVIRVLSEPGTECLVSVNEQGQASDGTETTNSAEFRVNFAV